MGLADVPLLAGGLIGPVLYFTLGVGLAGVLWGIAAMLSRPTEAPRPLMTRLDEIAESLSQIDAGMAALRDSIDRIAPGDASPPVNATDPTNIERIALLLEELRDITLMTDEQRRARARDLGHRRRDESLRQVDEALASQDWARAEALLSRIDAAFPGDERVQACREKLDRSRAAVEAGRLEDIRSRIEDLIAMTAWDAALAETDSFLRQFPDNADALALRRRIEREHRIFNDSTVEHLYNEIRHDTDRRNWRRALSAARRLLERFPDHPRTRKIARQFDAIEENAQIQERHEQETRIQELIRARRFDDAIKIAESLIEHYPTSPQAETLRNMLPVLHERSRNAP